MDNKDKKVRFNGKFFDDLRPDMIRKLTTEELLEFIEVIQSYRIDFVIVRDLIHDRNDFRLCYNKLYNQLLDNGIKPVIDYYSKEERGN